MVSRTSKFDDRKRSGNVMRRNNFHYKIDLDSVYGYL